MSTDACKCGCGRPVHAQGYASACYRRWLNSGKPASGPPPPMDLATRNRMALAARDANARKPDAEDRAWEQGRPARMEAQARRNAARARRQAAALARCEAAGDAKGVRELRLRITDWQAVRAALAARATTDGAERERAAAGDRKLAAFAAALDILRALREEVSERAA